jgi:hypothetical protein
MNLLNSRPKFNRHYFWLLVLYFLAHGPILILGNAVYWDDWTLFGAPKSDILDEFSQAGSFLNYAGLIHVAFSYTDPWSYKLATFICIYLAGIYLYKILCRDVDIGRNISYWIALLFLTTPLYIARVAAIDFIYTLSVFLFVLGWWYLKICRPLAVLLFATSFNTQSLLVFYALPVALFCFQRYERKRPLKFFFSHLDLLSLPFLWFILKITYFIPFGAYIGYNSNFALKNILISTTKQFYDFKNFIQSFIFSINDIEFRSVVFFLVFVSSFYFLKLYSYKIPFKKNIVLFIFGLAALILGLTPYWLLGHVPTFFEWTSRHQLLMPFGVAFIITSLANLLSSLWQRGFLLALVAASISINLSNYRDFYFDWQKQKSIIDQLSKLEPAKNASLLVFDDKTKNAIYRTYRTYEWNGLINQAFPEEYNRFGINKWEFEDYKKGAMDKGLNRYYSSGSHVKAKKHEIILISITKDRGQIVVSAKQI